MRPLPQVLRSSGSDWWAVMTVADDMRATVEAFINERPGYITALKNTRGTDDQSDYHRWQGGAEARRQLANALGWTVPHERNDKTKEEQL